MSSNNPDDKQEKESAIKSNVREGRENLIPIQGFSSC
jgi:hypothetical protein